MLFQLILVRLLPILMICMVKEQKKMKCSLWVMLICCTAGILFACSKIVIEQKAMSLLAIPAAMLPHYFFYGFTVKLLLRLVRHSWSVRVRKRICLLVIVSVFAGILSENYINDKILQIFVENFK